MLFVNLTYSQNIVKYFSYKMDNPKKSYSVYLEYNNNRDFETIMINTYSYDPIYDKSSFFINKENLSYFRIYLMQVSAKQLEWDAENLINRESEITKRIETEKDFKLTCSYSDGPNFPESPLYTTYTSINYKSALSISSPTYENIKRSEMFFLSNNALNDFIEKLKHERIQQFIDNDYKRKSKLK